MNLSKRAIAEFFGTFWLVFGGCGSAVLAAAFPQLGIGFYGVALAFGLTVLTMAYAIGHISGCHLNPAVSIGLVTGKRFPASELVPYVVAQVTERRFRFQRIWRALSRRILAALLPRCRSGAHRLFSHDHHGCHGPARARGLCPHCYWIGTNAHPSGRNSSYKSVRKPRA